MKTINISKLNNKIKTIKAVGMACMTLSVFFLSGCANKRDGLTITNVSYDPTREFYEEYNDIFADYYMNHYGKQIKVIQSHGGSGSQARSVVEGCNADVVTLALEHDITLIENTGLIAAGWKDEYDKDSAPYTSTIVFLVRKGNPFGIKDWDDLTADGVEIITPDPKSSGGACWNFLAALSFAEEKYTDESSKKEFLRKLYSNVSVLDSGARGSTTTFVENKKGDVLIAWENEARRVEKTGNDTTMPPLLPERRSFNNSQRQPEKQRRISASDFPSGTPSAERSTTVMSFLNRMGRIRYTES